MLAVCSHAVRTSTSPQHCAADTHCDADLSAAADAALAAPGVPTPGPAGRAAPRAAPATDSACSSSWASACVACIAAARQRLPQLLPSSDALSDPSGTLSLLASKSTSCCKDATDASMNDAEADPAAAIAACAADVFGPAPADVPAPAAAPGPLLGGRRVGERLGSCRARDRREQVAWSAVRWAESDSPALTHSDADSVRGSVEVRPRTKPPSSTVVTCVDAQTHTHTT